MVPSLFCKGSDPVREVLPGSTLCLKLPFFRHLCKCFLKRQASPSPLFYPFNCFSFFLALITLATIFSIVLIVCSKPFPCDCILLTAESQAWEPCPAGAQEPLAERASGWMDGRPPEAVFKVLSGRQSQSRLVLRAHRRRLHCRLIQSETPGWCLGTCVLVNSPGDSDAHLRVRTTGLEDSGDRGDQYASYSRGCFDETEGTDHTHLLRDKIHSTWQRKSLGRFVDLWLW